MKILRITWLTLIMSLNGYAVWMGWQQQSFIGCLFSGVVCGMLLMCLIVEVLGKEITDKDK